jgi:hypothetical protein
MTHIADKCMECTEPGGTRLLCDRHARQYDGMEPFDLDEANDAFAEFVAPFCDDICHCASCRSDVAGIVPCMKETER